MSRYIDADDAIYELERALPIDDFGKIVRCISRTPTADVVEVVRCKECKYWERDVIFQDGWCRGKHQGDPNWFCADGERREDDL